MAWRNACKIVSVVVGPLLIILGASMKWAIFPVVVDNMVKANLKLDPSNTQTWEAWVEPPITPYMRFTFFNVENADEIKEGGKPRVKEVGDFAYKEVRRKEMILPVQDQISFGSYIHYEFDPDASGADAKNPNTTITIVNPVMAIINAMLWQAEQALHFDNLNLGVTCEQFPSFTCNILAPIWFPGEQICKNLPSFTLIGETICEVIPDGNYTIPCNTLPADLVDACTNIAPDGSLDIEFKDGNIIVELFGAMQTLSCIDNLGPLAVHYDKSTGNLTIQNSETGETQPDVSIPFLPICSNIMEIIGKVPCLDLIGGLLSCDDPLHIWPIVEKLIIEPLAERVSYCDNDSTTTTTTPITTITTTPTTTTTTETTSTPTTTTTGDLQRTAPSVGDCDNIDYDSVPPECFCDGLTMTDTPSKMIFSGAHSGVLLALHNVLECLDLSIFFFDQLKPLFQCVNVAAIVDDLLEDMGLNLIDLKQGKFGFFRGPDGSNATRSWWKINSGKYQLSLYNQVLEFNGQTVLPDAWWENFGPTFSAHKAGIRGVCHDIIGTDGLGYAPPISKEDDIWLFNDQLCRSIWLSFADEVDIDGVLTYQFSPTPDVFSMSNPNNFCYCPKVETCAREKAGTEDEWDISDCQNRTTRRLMACHDGLLSLQGCQGAPVIMSTPHYLDSDPRLAAEIDGIQPNKDLHTTILNIEPTTGLPIQAHKRIQVSVPLAQTDDFEAFSGIKDVIFPVVWVDEGADIDQENLDTLKSMLVTPFLLVDIGVGILMGLGGVLIILAGGLHCTGRS